MSLQTELPNNMNNETFAELTPEQKRVAIAKDALEQIENGYFSLKSNGYWKIFSSQKSLGTTIGQKELTDSDTFCHVCAAGALFISGIRLFNSEVINPINSRPELVKNIWFSREQLALIEAAFEPVGRCRMRINISWGQFEEAQNFRLEGSSSRELLINILNNIIKNNGTFIP